MTTPATQQRIFMTGANGYIGSVITEFAIAEGYHVTGLSRSEKGDSKLLSLGATPVRGDLSNHDVLTRESTKADIVIHLADALAQNIDKDYSVVVEIDNRAVDAIAEGLKGSGKVFIDTSGSLVSAADPNGGETNEGSPMWEKPLNRRRDCEKHALKQCEKGIKAMAIRLAPYVYGRGGSGVRLFMARAVPAGEVTYVDEGATRVTTVHVDDAARLYLLAIKHGKAGEAYNATYETHITNRELAEAMGQALDLPVRSESFENTVKKMGGAFARMMGIEDESTISRIGTFFAEFRSKENRASNAKAVKELGWQPKEKGIMEEIGSGSYVEVAVALRKPAA
jgi:nucleoside-diphosphate-sugar epimerase